MAHLFSTATYFAILCVLVSALNPPSEFTWEAVGEHVTTSYPNSHPKKIHPVPTHTQPKTESEEIAEENELAKMFFDQLREKFEEDLKATSKTFGVPSAGSPTIAPHGHEDHQPSQKETEEEAQNHQDMMEIVQKAQQLQQKFAQLPKSLAKLIFGNNTEAVAHTGWDRPVNGVTKHKQISCVSACEDLHKEIVEGEASCSELSSAIDCLAKCRPGLFSDYIYNAAKKIKQQHCRQNESNDHHELSSVEAETVTFNLNEYIAKKAQTCFKRVLSDVKPVANIARHALGCYLEFEEAGNNKEACYALKYCAVESTAQKLKEECKDPELAEAMKYAAVYSLTKLSADGNLIRECPTLYDIEY